MAWSGQGRISGCALRDKEGASLVSRLRSVTRAAFALHCVVSGGRLREVIVGAR